MTQMIADGAAVSYGDDRLVVFFSSRGAYRKGTFDCTDFSKDMPYSKLFLRDEAKDYFYHNGIPGLTNSMDENVEFLRYFIGKTKPSRVTFIGASLGAYGALVMGHLIGVDDIHLVSLVSYLDKESGGDPENSQLWEGVFEPVTGLFQERGFDPKYLNSRNIVEENLGKVRVVRQHVATSEPVDMNHAALNRDFPHVETITHDRGRHGTIVAGLMRSGSLAADLATPIEDLERPLAAAS
ncbi:hypothetical protein [Actibacterium lipolyticum]|nr:hypothetical protein [Actibacterium lipolyticum]